MCPLVFVEYQTIDSAGKGLFEGEDTVSRLGLG